MVPAQPSSAMRRCPFGLATNSATSGGTRPAAIRLSRVTGMRSTVRDRYPSSTTSTGSPAVGTAGGRYTQILRRPPSAVLRRLCRSSRPRGTPGRGLLHGSAGASGRDSTDAQVGTSVGSPGSAGNRSRRGLTGSMYARPVRAGRTWLLLAAVAAQVVDGVQITGQPFGAVPQIGAGQPGQLQPHAVGRAHRPRLAAPQKGHQGGALAVRLDQRRAGRRDVAPEGFEGAPPFAREARGEPRQPRALLCQRTPPRPRSATDLNGRCAVQYPQCRVSRPTRRCAR